MSIQAQQLINLFLLLLLGYFFSNLYLQWYEIGIILLYTLVLDIFLFQSFHNFILCYSFSSLVTSMGVILMMITPQFWIYFVVITLALLQKKYLTLKKQHFFNPSNFALVMALLFFYKDAHIVLGQLGDEFWLSMLLCIMAILILIRVNRWMITLSFIFFYLFFQYFFIVKSDPVLVMEEVYYRFYSVSFILFLLFMLTDPRTTPSKGYQQLIFAFSIALFTTLLDYFYGFRVQHLFLSLFVFSMFMKLLFFELRRDKKFFYQSFLLSLLLLTILIFIENRVPYYFTMKS